MILLDTDHLSVLTDNRATGNAALVERLELAAEPLIVPIGMHVGLARLSLGWSVSQRLSCGGRWSILCTGCAPMV